MIKQSRDVLCYYFSLLWRLKIYCCAFSCFMLFESISYEFGPGTGLITLSFPPDKMPDTKADLVALGFITMADNGVLVRIDSGTSNDYMELEIVDGNIYMVYNMGTEDHPIGEHSVHVNDGQYHVVRFTRSGPNSTIQVDEHNVRVKQPLGSDANFYIRINLLVIEISTILTFV
ncbi:UNVERIFIED_CONTAM: Nrxn1 [Trichonephila clavipes]